MMKYWGEIEDNTEVFHAPDVTEDIEKSMNKFCLAEFETEYDNVEVATYECIDLNSTDPLILHAIALHKYANDLSEKIRVAELAIESNVLPPYDAVMPIPEKPKTEQKHVPNSFNYIPKDFTDFYKGEEITMAEISESVAKQAIAKATAVMFAHIGFESTHNSVLNFMSDVVEQFMKTITQKFKVAHDDMEEGLSVGFPNAIERTLVETGIGSCSGLHDFYQTRVINYIDVLTNRCKSLDMKYKTLLIPKTPSPSNLEFNSLTKIKEELDQDLSELENPEINLSGIEGELGYSSLETGYQLLNSLENDSSLQALMDGDEEIVVSTPNMTMSEGDMTNITITTKKKRTK